MNPGGKVATIIAGMAAGADSIDDLQVVRSGGMRRIFGQVYARPRWAVPARVHPRSRQSAGLGCACPSGFVLAGRTDLLPGIEQVAFVDIDSLLRPVYGHAKQGASFRHTKIAGEAGAAARPVAAGGHDQHRDRGTGDRRDPAAGRTPARTGCRLDGSGRVRTARAAGATGAILVRGDSAYGTNAVTAACIKEGHFSVVLTKNAAVCRAIAAIDQDAWIPVHYPGAVLDPDTGALISDAQVAETSFTAFATTDTPLTARLVVRRVRRPNQAR